MSASEIQRPNHVITISKRFITVSPVVLALLYLTVFSSTTYAFMRLAAGALGLFWAGSGSAPITYCIQARGSGDILDLSDEAAFRLSFKAWEQVADSHIRFSEVTDPGQKGRMDYTAGDIHLCFFDEDGSSGFFGASSGVIAVTPLSFFTNGQIADADIIFNGRDHRFSTDGSPGTFDVQNIATHEAGHFIGLDHSAVFGATMYPFATQGMIGQRSLEEDDVAAAASVYAEAGVLRGAISGTAVHNDGNTPINGGHVVAIDVLSGAVASATRTSSSGAYTVSGLPPASYQIYIEPLDGPVQESNLQASGLQTDFGTTFLGGNANPAVITVQGSGTTSTGEPLVANPPVGLNITGINNGGRYRVGQVSTVFLFGSGFSAGDQVEVSGGDLSVRNVSVSGIVSFQLDVRAAARPGLRNVLVRKASGEVAALTGGIELTQPAPVLSALTPAKGEPGGGNTIALEGSEFRAGVEVTIGGQLGTNTTLDSSVRVRTTVPAAAQGVTGAVDVVVLNPDGQFVVRRGGYSYSQDPALSSVEPAAGPTSGAITVTLQGANLVSPLTVMFGTQPAKDVVVKSSQQATCSLPAGALGKVDVSATVGDATPMVLSKGFEYIAPQITGVSPTLGSTNGGTEVVISGRGFSLAATVRFENLKAPGSTVSPDGTGITVLAPVASGLSALRDEQGRFPVMIEVRNPDGSLGTGAGFSYVEAAQPMIASVSPASGLTSGGEKITLRGTDFEAGVTVTLAGKPATEVELVDSTTITFKTPANPQGGVDLVVANPSGLKANLGMSSANTFVYNQPTLAAGGGGGGGGGGCAALGHVVSPRLPADLPWPLLLVALLALRRRRTAA